MKAYKIELLVIDFDQMGGEDIKNTIENTRYPNHCINPSVQSIQEADIGIWDDDHPLNKHDTASAEYARLFSEHSLSAQDEVLTDEKISAIYEQSQGMTLRDRDFQGVAAFARALVKAAPAPANPSTEIREAILQYYDDLSARKHGGVAQDKAFQAIQDALGMSWSSGTDHRAKYATPSPSLAVRDVVELTDDQIIQRAGEIFGIKPHTMDNVMKARCLDFARWCVDPK